MTLRRYPSSWVVWRHFVIDSPCSKYKLVQNKKIANSYDSDLLKCVLIPESNLQQQQQKSDIKALFYVALGKSLRQHKKSNPRQLRLLLLFTFSHIRSKLRRKTSNAERYCATVNTFECVTQTSNVLNKHMHMCYNLFVYSSFARCLDIFKPLSVCIV